MRLVATFNKVEIKVIAKKMLSNYTFVTSKYNRGAAARRGWSVPRSRLAAFAALYLYYISIAKIIL